jgi:hypothetical protein
VSERWRPVPGYEGWYEVSDLGRVRSGARNRALKPYTVKSGHQRVTLSKQNVRRSAHIHRLVLTAFLGPAPTGMEVCHNDGDPANNLLSNLRWDTKKGNAQDRRRHGNDAHARLTHCPQGHEYSAANTYYTPSGHRHCRICVLSQQKAKRVLIRQQKAA